MLRDWKAALRRAFPGGIPARAFGTHSTWKIKLPANKAAFRSIQADDPFCETVPILL
jgi:hypothetical protein